MRYLACMALAAVACLAAGSAEAQGRSGGFGRERKAALPPPGSTPTMSAPAALFHPVDCRVLVQRNNPNSPTTVQIRASGATLSSGTRVSWHLRSEYVGRVGETADGAYTLTAPLRPGDDWVTAGQVRELYNACTARAPRVSPARPMH